MRRQGVKQLQPEKNKKNLKRKKKVVVAKID